MVVLYFHFIFVLIKKGSKTFRTHAGRVVTVINDAIVALDSPDAVEQLEEMWGKIGETHSKRKISKDSFNVTYSVTFLLLRNNFVSIHSGIESSYLRRIDCCLRSR